MASRLGVHLARSAQVCRGRNVVSAHTSLLKYSRSLHSSLPTLAARSEDLISDEDALDLLDDQYEDDDTVSAGHNMLREHRQTLHYLRLIEHEMPKLVAFRRPFQPLKSDVLITRSIDYAGEEHPVTRKRVVVASLDSLPLKDEDVMRKFKLLAGPRWTPKPPADSGVSSLESWGNGFIKIACEDFPQPAQNLKWINDTLNKLIEEANDPKDKFKDVPIDIRHIYSKARKAKKGEHLRGRVYNRPTVHDFPQEWLPERTIPSSSH